MLVKVLGTILLLFFINSSSFGQNIDEQNIYYRALKEYSRWVERFEPDTDTLYFEHVKGITTFFPKEINGLQIIIITGLNQKEIYENNGGKLIHRKMTPVQVTDSKIDIGVIPYQGQYSAEQGGLRLGLSKWHSIIFEYDQESNSFKYKTIQNNG